MKAKLQKVGIWVKASERLTEHMFVYGCRWAGNMSILFNAYYDEDKDKYVVIGQKEKEIAVQYIEWLEEKEMVVIEPKEWTGAITIEIKTTST